MRIWRHCYFRSSCRFKIVLTLQYVEVLHWAEVFHAFCSIQIYGITIMAEGKYLLEKNFLFFKKLQKVVYYAVAKQNDENMLFNPSLGRQERMCVLQQWYTHSHPNSRKTAMTTFYLYSIPLSCVFMNFKMQKSLWTWKQLHI